MEQTQEHPREPAIPTALQMLASDPSLSLVKNLYSV